jgi:hypothetical protein
LAPETTEPERAATEPTDTEPKAAALRLAPPALMEVVFATAPTAPAVPVTSTPQWMGRGANGRAGAVDASAAFAPASTADAESASGPATAEAAEEPASAGAAAEPARLGPPVSFAPTAARATRPPQKPTLPAPRSAAAATTFTAGVEVEVVAAAAERWTPAAPKWRHSGALAAAADVRRRGKPFVWEAELPGIRTSTSAAL